MFTRNSHGAETYGYGITRSYIDNGNIIIFRTQGDMSRDAINTWASMLILTMQEWKSERPIAALHDLTHPNQGLTPHARERTIDVMKRRPKGLTIYSAVVLPNTFMHRIIDMFLRTPIFHQAGHEVRIFPSESQALDWLREQLAKHR